MIGLNTTNIMLNERTDEVLEALKDQLETNYDKIQDQLYKSLEAADPARITLTQKTNLDFTENAPLVIGELSFTTREHRGGMDLKVTYSSGKQRFELPDPNQLDLPVVSPLDGEDGRKRGSEMDVTCSDPDPVEPWEEPVVVAGDPEASNPTKKPRKPRKAKTAPL
jgi:hypothetical protein